MSGKKKPWWILCYHLKNINATTKPTLKQHNLERNPKATLNESHIGIKNLSMFSYLALIIYKLNRIQTVDGEKTQWALMMSYDIGLRPFHL